MIRLVDVYKSFGPKHVLQGFTLDVLEGETMVIIGYSGSGKSVAIKHIVGLLEPDSGQVFVDDLEVPRLSRRDLYKLRARIGYVFQFAALFDSFTIGDNVAMGLRKQQELSETEIQRRVHEALELVDLPNVADRFPAELSGGMRKRVGIARAIALRPKYILYDEPTTGLDPVTSAVIDQLMVRMRDTLGVTGIVITHDMRSAYTVGTRIAMLYEGRVRQAGTVDEIQHSTDPIVRQFIEGKANIELEAAEQGAPCTAVAPGRSNRRAAWCSAWMLVSRSICSSATAIRTGAFPRVTSKLASSRTPPPGARSPKRRDSAGSYFVAPSIRSIGSSVSRGS